MYYESNEISHHGVKGMKWGIRRKIRENRINARGLYRASSNMIGDSRRKAVMAKARKYDEEADRLQAELDRIRKSAEGNRMSKGKIATRAILGTLGGATVAAAGFATYKLGRSYIQAGRMKHVAELTAYSLRRYRDTL